MRLAPGESFIDTYIADMHASEEWRSVRSRLALATRFAIKYITPLPQAGFATNYILQNGA